jgi:hypothetical protein
MFDKSNDYLVTAVSLLYMDIIAFAVLVESLSH